MAEELYENALILYQNGHYHSCEMVLELMAPESINSLLLYAECLSVQQQYSKAFRIYELASSKYKFTKPNRFYEAGIGAREIQKVRDYLEEIPKDSRTLQHLKYLVTVYDNLGAIKDSIDTCKLILSQQPFAFEYIKNLILQGVSLKEIKKIIQNEFVIKYATGLYNVHTCQYSEAVATFNSLLVQYKCSPMILTELALTYLRSGDFNSSMHSFVKLRRLYPENVDDLDAMAILLHKKGNITAIERLMLDIDILAPGRPESLVIKGIWLHATGDNKQSLQILDKAISADQRRIITHQVKATVLFEMGKLGEAAACYRNAYKIGRDISIYQGLINTYLKLGKMSEASLTAKEALALFPHSGQALTMVGQVLEQNNGISAKAKEYYEKGLEMDPNSLVALLALADYLYKYETCQNAINLLEDYASRHHVDTFHVRLGDYYANLNEYSKATQNYQIALNINSQNQLAKDGIANVEKLITGVEAEMSEDEEVELQSDI